MLDVKKVLAKILVSLNGKVNGMETVVIRDSSHVQSIPAYSYKDVTYNLTSLGATKGGAFVGYSVLTDSNQNLILNFASITGNNIVVRFHNPTNTAQTMHGVIAILKYLD